MHKIQKVKRRQYAFDFLILAFIIVLTLALFFLAQSAYGRKISTVSISLDGKHVATLDLSEDTVYEVVGTDFSLEIKEGRATVLSTDCPDRTCIGMSVTEDGGAIVCLPNRIVVDSTRGTADYDYKAG